MQLSIEVLVGEVVCALFMAPPHFIFTTLEHVAHYGENVTTNTAHTISPTKT